jgi:flagellar basal-body rod protein FlgF
LTVEGGKKMRRSLEFTRVSVLALNVLQAAAMDPLSVAAAGGLRSRMESLDMLANNIANAATTGFKADRESYGLYGNGEGDEVASEFSTLPMVEKAWTDFSQGTLQPTGNSLDFALSGKGFFSAQGPNGTLFTRNGSFRISSTGRLETNEGHPVRAVGGGTIQLNGDGKIEVGRDGTVTQNGVTAGRLEIVEFPDQQALMKAGNTYFRARDPQAQPPAATAAEVHQGKLEGSNISSSDSAVRLVSVLRQFEMLQKAVTVSTDMNRKSLEEVARVSG